MTSHDMARGEAQRDFADAVGINSRALIEGLFGVHPNAIAGILTIAPGFPDSVGTTQISVIQISNFFGNRNRIQSCTGILAESYDLISKFPRPMQLRMQIRKAMGSTPKSRGEWQAGRVDTWATNLFGAPLHPNCQPGEARISSVAVSWQGEPPRARLPDIPAEIAPERASQFDWNKNISAGATFETIDLTPFF